MDKKAFFFDIDGTLLSEKTGEVPESTFDALKKLRDFGHLTFINTGRTPCSLPPELKAMPFSGFLCGCGTHIAYENQILLSKHIEHARGREMIDLMEKCKVDPILEGEEDCYFPSRHSRFEKLEFTRRYFKNMGIGIESYLHDDNYEYDKYVFYADEQSDMTRLMENLKQDMDVMDRGNGFYEIVPIGYTKSTAIDYVLDYFKIDRNLAYVFGDSSNDLSMFQTVDHAIAMAEHDPILDPYTEFVTKAVEEDGIYYALEHYNIL